MSAVVLLSKTAVDGADEGGETGEECASDGDWGREDAAWALSPSIAAFNTMGLSAPPRGNDNGDWQHSMPFMPLTPSSSKWWDSRMRRHSSAASSLFLSRKRRIKNIIAYFC